MTSRSSEIDLSFRPFGRGMLEVCRGFKQKSPLPFAQTKGSGLL